MPMNVTSILVPLAVVGMLLAYLICGRIGRRSSEYGGGTALLSWVGFFVPCIAWIVLFQTYTALQRSQSQSHPQATENMKAFKTWLMVFIACLLISSFLGTSSVMSKP
jgi:heme/copper-type cytochrome/quinol oxidase subunit 3